jgi:L-asparaginase II
MDRTNPVVAELWRGDGVESIHRGAWVLVDTEGNVVDARGEPDQLVYARSATKSIQALPLVETTATGSSLTNAEIAVAISSHNGQDFHVAAATAILERAGLDADALQCGPQAPANAPGVEPLRITNNCSGKHAGFLAAALEMGDLPENYLNPESAVQRAVHRSMMEMTGADKAQVTTAVDGCSAPTYRLPLRYLATGLARMANPENLGWARAAACGRIVAAATAEPALIGGTSSPRFDTRLIETTNGRLFSKGGAEGVQTVGIVGAGLGFAAKIDDGSTRSLHRLTLAVLDAHELIHSDELARLSYWADESRRNRDNLDVGRHVLTDEGRPT